MKDIKLTPGMVLLTAAAENHWVVIEPGHDAGLLRIRIGPMRIGTVGSLSRAVKTLGNHPTNLIPVTDFDWTEAEREMYVRAMIRHRAGVA